MNPKDRPKIIGLVVAIVLVIGFVMKTMLSGREQPVNAPPPVAQTSPPAGSSGADATSSSALLSKMPPATVAYTGVDPFRSVFPSAGAPGGSPAGGNAQRMTERGVKPPTGNGPTIPNPWSNGPNKPIDVPHPAEAEIKVEGVVIDSGGKMAIISSGGKTEFLKLGQKYGDGFIVARIQPRAVTFERKGKFLVVEVGSTLGGPDFEGTPKSEF